MTPRRKKVQKVLEIREQTLHERAGVLVQAHEGRNLAESHALDAETHLVAATEYRRSLTAHSVNVASWIDAEQWLAHKTDRSLQAQLDLDNAEIFVLHCAQQCHRGPTRCQADGVAGQAARARRGKETVAA